MNYFSKRNIVIVVIAVLLIINIASISTIVYHSYDNKKAEEKVKPERKYSRSFKRDMNFTAEQMKSYAELKAEFRKQTREPLVEMQKVRMDLIKEMSSADPDTAKMFAMADDIGRLHAQIKRSTINHFLSLKNKTTPEQFEKFLRVFQHSIMDDNFGRWSSGQGQSRWSKGKRSERNN